MKTRILLLSFMLLTCLSHASTRINKDSWRELRDGLHYKQKDPLDGDVKSFENWSDEYKQRRKKDYLKSQPREKDLLKRKTRIPSPPSVGNWNLPTWSIYLAYGLVAVILLIVIYLIFFKSQKPKEPKLATQPIEELPIEKPFNELDALLAKSIAEGNYREAVRIYFIYIIKILREKGWIQWEKRKTNTAYLFEMRERREFLDFSQITLIFEIIWYGHREIDQHQFEKIKPQFEKLLKSIQSAHE